MYAWTSEVYNLITLRTLLSIHLDKSVLNNIAGIVLRNNVHHQFGTVVPYATNLFQIVPRHTHTIGTLVFPCG